MNMNELVKQSIEAAMQITGKCANDTETQEIAFKLSCAAMAKEHASNRVHCKHVYQERAWRLGCRS